jgi:hypothetical protein
MRKLIAAFVVCLCGPAHALDVSFSVPRSFATPVVEGATNLPDGIEMIISLHTPAPACRPNCKMYQSKVTVSGGRFKSEKFGAPPGTYKLIITTAVAELSPPSVQAVIGKKGEKLKGRMSLGPTVEYKSDVTITGR